MRSKWTNELNHSEECLHAVGERGIRGWEDLSKGDNALHCSGVRSPDRTRATCWRPEKLILRSSYSKALTLNFRVWSINWKLRSSKAQRLWMLSQWEQMTGLWKLDFHFAAYCDPFAALLHRTQKEIKTTLCSLSNKKLPFDWEKQKWTKN